MYQLENLTTLNQSWKPPQIDISGGQGYYRPRSISPSPIPGWTQSRSITPNGTGNRSRSTTPNAYYPGGNNRSRSNTPTPIVPVYRQRSSSSGYESQYKVYSNVFILALPAMIAILFIGISINLIQKNQDPNIELQGADRVLKYVFNNLDDDPVLDIVQKTDDCPKNYTDFGVGLWQGVSTGCLCQDGHVKLENECRFDATTGCQRVTTINEQNVYNWYDQYFCAQRTANLTRQFTPCTGKGEVKCANELCAKDGLCPDNKFTDKTATDPQPKLFFGDSYKKPSFDDTVKTTARPIIAFQFSPGDTICYDTQLAPQLTSKKRYPLFTQKFTGCGRYGSLNTLYIEKLASHSLLSFYTQNDLDTGLKQEPWWIQYQVSTDSLNLLAIKKLEIMSGRDAEKCLKVDKEDFKIASDYAIWGRQKLQRLSWIMLACSSFVLMLGFVFLLVKFVAIEDTSKVNVVTTYIVCGFILVIIGIVESLLYFFEIEIKMGKANIKLNEIRTNECFRDAGVNLAIDDMDKYHINTSNINLNSNYIYFIGSILYLILWIVLCFFIKKRQSQIQFKENQQYLQESQYHQQESQQYQKQRYK